MKQRVRSLGASTATATAIIMLLVSCGPSPEDAFTDGRIPCSVEEVSYFVPEPAPIPPGEGRHDWEMVDDGDVSREDIRRLVANLQRSGLDPDQVRALQNGENVADLPDGTLTYLEDLYGSAGLRGISNLQSSLATAGSPEACAARRALSDGLLTLSNENVSDASGAGGISRLPANLRPSVNPTFEMTRIWSTVAETTDMPPGDDLGIRMIRAASAQARSGVGSATPQLFLDIGARNRESASRILRGDLDGNGTAETNPAIILNPLFANDWDDEGQSVGTLVDWISAESAAARPDSMRERAGEAAYALSDYLTDTEVYYRLLDVDGDITSNLGEANPDLIASLARSLSRYVPHISGIGGAPEMPGWPGDAPELDATKLFTLLATDENASGAFHASALESALRSIGTYLDSVQRDPTNPDLTAAYDAGRIHALLDMGVFKVAAEHASDAKRREMNTYETKEWLYTSAVAVVSPFMGGLTAAGIIGGPPRLEQLLIGNPPEQLEFWSQVYSWDPEDARVAGLAHLLTQTIRRDPSFDPRATRLAPFFPNGRTDLEVDPSGTQWVQFSEAVSYILGGHYPDADLRAYASFYSDGYGSIAPVLRYTGIPIVVTVR